MAEGTEPEEPKKAQSFLSAEKQKHAEKVKVLNEKLRWKAKQRRGVNEA
jgi:hypothetical protein